MLCPYCGSDSRVLDSRGSSDSVRRRRECQECGRRFTTYEKFGLELRITKRDGGSEAFDRKKLLTTLQRLTWDRPVAERALEDLVRGLEAELADSGAQVVTSAALAERLWGKLAELDPLASNRFASNYQLDDGSVRFSREEDTSQLQLPILAPEAPDAEEPAPLRRRKRK